MLELKGLNRESIVLDGGWLDKLRAGTSVARVPVSGYREATITETARKKGIFSREREEIVTLVLAMQQMVGLVVPGDRREQVKRFVVAVEHAASQHRNLPPAGPATIADPPM